MNWQNILKSSSNWDFQKFLIEIFGIPRAVARKLTPSRSLMYSLGQGGLAKAITENEFEALINLVESEQYETFLRELEQINSKYTQLHQKRERSRINERQRERYANDPEYAEKTRRENREAYRRRKERKE